MCQLRKTWPPRGEQVEADLVALVRPVHVDLDLDGERVGCCGTAPPCRPWGSSTRTATILSSSGVAQGPAQVHRRAGARRLLGDVAADHVVRVSVGDEAAPVDLDGARAEAAHRGHVVADEEDGAPRTRDLLHLPEALALEGDVADREHLVDEQDLRVEVRRDGEGQAHVHAARVALDRRVEELVDLGELDDLVELARDLAPWSCRGWRRSGRCSRGRSAPGGSRSRPRAGCRRGRGSSALPSVGSVMRERILSSVLLPAPLRPMMPTTCPGFTSKLTSRSAQNVATWPVDGPGVPEAAEGRVGGARDRVPQRPGTLHVRADLVALADAADADGVVVTAHTTSAKMRSMRRK